MDACSFVENTSWSSQLSRFEDVYRKTQRPITQNKERYFYDTEIVYTSFGKLAFLCNMSEYGLNLVVGLTVVLNRKRMGSRKSSQSACFSATICTTASFINGPVQSCRGLSWGCSRGETFWSMFHLSRSSLVTWISQRISPRAQPSVLIVLLHSSPPHRSPHSGHKLLFWEHQTWSSKSSILGWKRLLRINRSKTKIITGR